MMQWLRAFAHAWPIAFPAILIVAPIVRKIVGAMIENDQADQ
jgi:hypothetical protein